MKKAVWIVVAILSALLAFLTAFLLLGGIVIMGICMDWFATPVCALCGEPFHGQKYETVSDDLITSYLCEDCYYAGKCAFCDDYALDGVHLFTEDGQPICWRCES